MFHALEEENCIFRTLKRPRVWNEWFYWWCLLGYERKLTDTPEFMFDHSIQKEINAHLPWAQLPCVAGYLGIRFMSQIEYVKVLRVQLRLKVGMLNVWKTRGWVNKWFYGREFMSSCHTCELRMKQLITSILRVWNVVRLIPLAPLGGVATEEDVFLWC